MARVAARAACAGPCVRAQVRSAALRGGVPWRYMAREGCCCCGGGWSGCRGVPQNGKWAASARVGEAHGEGRAQGAQAGRHGGRERRDGRVAGQAQLGELWAGPEREGGQERLGANVADPVVRQVQHAQRRQPRQHSREQLRPAVLDVVEEQVQLLQPGLCRQPVAKRREIAVVDRAQAELPHGLAVRPALDRAQVLLAQQLPPKVGDVGKRPVFVGGVSAAVLLLLDF
mmetsp:Transcript_2086/g.6477  ORF Transcript_2086/g.6477 Transcript_2086/m.6477 type:complete len:229 (+) Transcript_2086:346-1032(+)